MSNLLSGCLLASMAGVLLWQSGGGSHPGRDKVYASFGHWLDQFLFADPQLEAQRIAVTRFTHANLDLEADYITSRLSLEETVNQVIAASLEIYPEHLDLIARFEPGASHEERVARNIVRHIEEDDDLKQNRELLERVRRELAELIRKYQQPAVPMLGAMAA